MQDQQMLLYQQISNLKTEAEKANAQREETKKIYSSCNCYR